MKITLALIGLVASLSTFTVYAAEPSPTAAETIIPTTGPQDVLRAVTMLLGAVSSDSKAQAFSQGMGTDDASQLVDIKHVQTSDGHLAYVYTGKKSAGVNAPFTIDLRVDSVVHCSQGSPDTADSAGCSSSLTTSFPTK